MKQSSPVGMMLQFAFGPGPTSTKSSSSRDTQAIGAMTCGTSSQKLALATAARQWWESSRSEGWSLEQHLATPVAGCSASAQERALAATVAQWVKQGS
jgi:hypothetical protein